jgi:hypothetical protein
MREGRLSPAMNAHPVISTGHVSPMRVVAVTFGLIGMGAVAGALAGALAVTAWLGITEGLTAGFDLAAWTVAGGVGGALGALLLPATGFTMLRHVPLGRVLGHSILATAMGGILGVQFLGGWWLAGPLCGFGLAAGRLWLVARRARAG